MLDAFVAAEPDLSWARPEAGLIGLARLPGGVDSDAFARALLAPPHRTFAIPGSAYGQPGHIRLGVGGGAEANLAEGLARPVALRCGGPRGAPPSPARARPGASPR